MTKKMTKGFTRRKFLRSGSVGLGLGMWTGAHSTATCAPSANRARPKMREKRLPREVWVATISQDGMEARSCEEMIEKLLGRMEEMISCEPDIICLPEVSPLANLSSGRPAVSKVAEAPIGDISRPFAEFAQKHNCYIVCPIYTKEKGHYYNSAVFFDRKGKLLGEYRKIHPTIGEMNNGISPGPLTPPVFKTDFGIIGAQICFDIEWDDGWKKLRQAGAEIVFWPSAFAGGSMVNTKAWQNQYCVVSSTRKDTSKICDITGEEAGRTSHWNHWVCTPLNLEKAFLHTWPYVRRFPEIKVKYGRKIRIRNFGEEEWSILESRSPEVRISDIMKEFELKTYKEHIHAADVEQRARRTR